MTTKLATLLPLSLFLSACALFQPPPSGRAGGRRGPQAADACPTASPWAAASGLVGVVQGMQGNAQGNAGAAPQPSANGGGCSKDTDCKGDRVCDRGSCVAAKQ